MLLIMILLTAMSAHAEEKRILDALDLEAFEEAGSAAGVDVGRAIQELLTGDLQTASGVLSALAASAKTAILKDIRSVVLALTMPMLVSLTLRLMLGRKASAGGAIHFVCRASVVAALSAVFARLSSTADALMSDLLRCSNALAPAMIAAVTLSGSESAAAMLTPMSALCANLIQNLLGRWGLALCSAAAAVAIGGNLSGSVRLKRLHGLFKQMLNWMAGLLMAGFMSALSIQGRLSSGRDSVTAQTARYAIESIVPVIGGDVSDSLDSLLATAFAVKNALGVSGLIVLCAVCLTPLCRLAGMSLALKAASAIAEPLGDDAMTAMTGQFADAVEMLLVVCLVGAVLCAMLTGSCMNAAANIAR